MGQIPNTHKPLFVLFITFKKLVFIFSHSTVIIHVVTS